MVVPVLAAGQRGDDGEHRDNHTKGAKPSDGLHELHLRGLDLSRRVPQKKLRYYRPRKLTGYAGVVTEIS